MTKEKKAPESIEDADLDQAQGAGAGVSPFMIQRNESDLQVIHGSDYNAAMGNSGREFHGSDFNTAVETTIEGGRKNANNGEGW